MRREIFCPSDLTLWTFQGVGAKPNLKWMGGGQVVPPLKIQLDMASI